MQIVSRPSDSYPIFAVAMLILTYGLLLKLLVAISLVFFSCLQFRYLWSDSLAFPAFVVVSILLAVFSAAPMLRQAFGAQTSKADFWWSFAATGFALYISAMLVVLYAFVHPGSMLSRLFGFEAGGFACI